MKRVVFLIASVLLLFSCVGSGNKSEGSKGGNKNYLDREVSVYSTGASAIDEKMVFHRSTKEYEYYTKAVIYPSSEWVLEDKGHYTESFDNDNIVTCKLDNAKVKGDERLGTIHTVIIDLAAKTAELISIAGRHIATETNE